MGQSGISTALSDIELSILASDIPIVAALAPYAIVPNTSDFVRLVLTFKC